MLKETIVHILSLLASGLRNHERFVKIRANLPAVRCVFSEFARRHTGHLLTISTANLHPVRGVLSDVPRRHRGHLSPFPLSTAPRLVDRGRTVRNSQNCTDQLRELRGVKGPQSRAGSVPKKSALEHSCIHAWWFFGHSEVSIHVI